MEAESSPKNLIANQIRLFRFSRLLDFFSFPTSPDRPAGSMDGYKKCLEVASVLSLDAQCSAEDCIVGCPPHLLECSNPLVLSLVT